MESPAKVLKSVAPKLVPFFKTAAVYFVLFIPSDRPSLQAAGVKCAPIISLVVFALLHGMSLGNEYAFSRRIIAGLLFSCIGDALLIWPQYFMHGMASFGAAQVLYCWAFGFKPMNPFLGIICYAIGIVFVLVMLPGLSGVMLVGLPMYAVLLMTMAWRAVARVQFFQDLWTWTKLCSCAGGILFVISDALIAISQFHTQIPHAQEFIMATYYAAQLGITLSVVDSKDCYKAKEKLKHQHILNSEGRVDGKDRTPNIVEYLGPIDVPRKRRRSAVPIK